MIKPCRECQQPVHSAADRCTCGAILPGRPMQARRIADPFDYSPFVRALSTDGRVRVRVDLAGMEAAVRAAEHIANPPIARPRLLP